MSLLTIAQAVSDFIGYERPTTVVNNTDPIARQLLVLINREGKQLMRAHNWPILSKEHTFTTANGTQNYALPTDFDRFVSGTAYNRTELDALVGPITPQQYHADRFGTVTGGVVDRFRLKPASNVLRFDITPTPNGTETVGFEYISSHWNQTTGGTSQAEMAADTDIGILDELLIEMGVTWRFKQSHGLIYDEDFRQYQIEVRQAISRSGGAPVLSLDDHRTYLVSPYSYNIPDSGFGV